MTTASAIADRAVAVFHGGSAATYPIDPVQLARSVGINVYSVKLANTLSGIIVKATPDGDVSIFLNSEHAPVRQRFTCAHELGHYFAIQELPDAATRTYIHRRDSLSACGTDGDEIFANQFGAQLLMPAESVRDARLLGMDSYELAARFHVSIDAMKYRLRNLGLA
jgi:Zn-dependent peptidase ImmA (M78 family)